LGIKASFSPLTVTNSEVFIDQVRDFSRPAFYSSPINYMSGSYLGITSTLFSSSEIIVTDCDWAYICYSNFVNSSGIQYDNDKHYTYANIFGVGNSMNIWSFGNSDAIDYSIISSNIFLNQDPSFLSTDPNTRFTCNFHDDRSTGSLAYWTLSGSMDQGEPDEPVRNVFLNSTIDLDSPSAYDYFHREFILDEIPKISNSSAIIVSATTFSPLINCKERSEIERNWTGTDLCGPEDWFISPDCDICDCCIGPPPEDPELLEQVGGGSGGNAGSALSTKEEGIENLKHTSDAKLVLKYKNSSLIIDSNDQKIRKRNNSTVTIYDVTGKTVFVTQQQDLISLSNTAEGLYFAILTVDNKIISRLQFFHK
jgi:hypothetical protein